MTCGVGRHAAAAAQQGRPIMTGQSETEGATQRGEGLKWNVFSRMEFASRQVHVLEHHTERRHTPIQSVIPRA